MEGGPISSSCVTKIIQNPKMSPVICDPNLLQCSIGVLRLCTGKPLSDYFLLEQSLIQLVPFPLVTFLSGLPLYNTIPQGPPICLLCGLLSLRLGVVDFPRALFLSSNGSFIDFTRSQ